jgi:PKD repeat protein
MSSRAWLAAVALLALLAACSDVEDDPTSTAPVARITVTPPTGPAPLSVAVSGAGSTAVSGTIASYEWTFGDGATATGTDAAHTFAAPGEYVITLKVTDDKGRSGTAESSAVATGPEAVYNASVYDGTEYQDEPTSGSYDTTQLQ